MDTPIIFWILFNAFVIIMLAFDLGLFHRKAHEVSLKEALTWTSIWVLLALVFNALIFYWKGQQPALEFFTDNKSRFFKKEYLERGSGFYTRYGMWAFILGRFMPVIRTLVPMIAGASSFPFRKFLLFNIFGAVTWIGTLVPLGYFIGKAYPEVIKYSVYLLLLFIAVASFPMLKIIFSKVKKP